MKSLLPLLTFLFFFSGISPNVAPPQEFRFALLIGNADYEGAAKLQNPINDIRRLSPLFKKYGFEVTQIENANQETMGKAIDNFSRKISQARQKNPQAQITTLFYYSGHGLSYEGRNYLLPVKVEIPNPESLQYRAKSLEEITSLFSSADVRLLFFDACRNEPPTRSWWRGLPDFAENQGLSSPNVQESAPRQNSDLNGTCIGYATALGKRALDGNASISPYAEAFEKELTNNPTLPLSELLTNIGQQVGKSTKYNQDPWQSSTRTVGRFRFDTTPKKAVEKENKEVAEKKKDLPTTKTLSNGVKLIRVEGGNFMMGSDKYSDTKPIHKVTLTDYYIGETEVTNAQYAAFLNKRKPSETELDEWINLNGSSQTEKCRILQKGDNYVVEKGYENHPVIYVSWFGANEFCKHYGGFLPSEAQWEYAARGGNKSQKYKYAGSNNLNEVAWYDENSYNKDSSHKDYGTHEVKTKKANELGLYDMSGNVWEWCQDWYDAEYYSKSEIVTNPINNSKSDYRVLRGGSWFSISVGCLVASRFRYNTTYRNNYIGFRICSPSIV